MKTSQAVLVIVVVVILSTFAFSWSKHQPRSMNIPPVVSVPVSSSSVTGCYVAGTAQDVYTLHIQGEQGGNVSGTLSFKNFEKDSSSGTFTGIYTDTDGILLGDYAFQSEGMDSVMQVIFKKSGDDFVRGYGPVDNGGTRFTDLNNITFDATSPLSVFKKGECPLNLK